METRQLIRPWRLVPLLQLRDREMRMYVIVLKQYR